MMRRGIYYLVAIIPLHYFAMLAASLPPALLLPPDILVQALMAVPLFAGLLFWSVPALLRRLGLLRSDQPAGAIRAFALGVAGLCIVLAVAGIVMGITTPLEAVILGVFALLAAHGLLLRRLL